MMFIGTGIVLVSALVGYVIACMYKCDAYGIEDKLDAYIKYVADNASDNQKIITALNKQLKILGDEQLKTNKRLKKLENK